MGAKAYELLRNLVAPDSPKDQRFNDLVKTMRVHLKPKPQNVSSFIKEFNVKMKRLQSISYH